MIPTKAATPKPLPAPISLTKVLLAEGDTPTHFVEALLRELGLSDSIEIRNFGGVRDLRTALSAIAATAEFQSRVVALGILRDAEDSALAARQSIENHRGGEHQEGSSRFDLRAAQQFRGGDAGNAVHRGSQAASDACQRIQLRGSVFLMPRRSWCCIAQICPAR